MPIKSAKILDRHKLQIDLRGPHGNAFFLMAQGRSLCKQLHKDWEPIEADMKSGNYDHLLAVFDREFGEYVDPYR